MTITAEQIAERLHGYFNFEDCKTEAQSILDAIRAEAFEAGRRSVLANMAAQRAATFDANGGLVAVYGAHGLTQSQHRVATDKGHTVGLVNILKSEGVPSSNGGWE